MFVIEAKFFSAVIIGLGVVLRPYILNHFKRNGFLGNFIYFAIIMLIALPINIYQPRFTFTSLDDKSAKDLVKIVLKEPLFKDFTALSNLAWKPYYETVNLYNIKASLYKDNNLYYIYLQPECKFLQGCQVTMDKILLINSEDENILIEDMNEAIFAKRACSDVIVQEILQERVNFFFATLMKKMDESQKLDFNYDIQSIHLKDFTELSNKLPQSPNNFKGHLSNSCSATYVVSSFLKTSDSLQKGVDIAFKVLFRNVDIQDNVYEITSDVKYDIYISDEKEVTLLAMPFNAEKFNMTKEEVEEALKKEMIKQEKSSQKR